MSRGDVVQSVAAPGQSECMHEVQLGMATGGQLAMLHVRPGDRVHEGDTLAGLDLAPLQQALTRAQAALERARQLAAAQLDLAVAHASLAKAQATAPTGATPEGVTILGAGPRLADPGHRRPRRLRG